MGAHSASAVFEGTLSPRDLVAKFEEHQEQLTVEYGTDPYNGTLSTCRGLYVETSKVFQNEEEAYQYAEDKAEKWGPACAVRVHQKDTTTTGFTFEGKSSQWTNSPVEAYYAGLGRITETRYRAADQLTPMEKAAALKLYQTARESEHAYKSAAHAVQGHVTPFTQDPAAPLPTGWTTTFRALRKTQVKATKAHAQAKAKWAAFEEKLRAKYVKTTTEDKGVVWLVVGMAAC